MTNWTVSTETIVPGLTDDVFVAIVDRLAHTDAAFSGGEGFPLGMTVTVEGMPDPVSAAVRATTIIEEAFALEGIVDHVHLGIEVLTTEEFDRQQAALGT